ARWSFTRPHACISAYSVVGPTKRKPWRLSSRASATVSGVVAGTSDQVEGGLPHGAGVWPRITSPSGRPAVRSSTVARAFAIVALAVPRIEDPPRTPAVHQVQAHLLRAGHARRESPHRHPAAPERHRLDCSRGSRHPAEDSDQVGGRGETRGGVQTKHLGSPA